MTFQAIINKLDATCYTEGTGYGTLDITNAVASDLMSDVLVIEDEKFILLTSLNSEQVIRTADIVGAVGVVLVNGKTPTSTLIEVAKEQEITLLATKTRKFAACAQIAQLLEAEGHPL